MEQRIGSGSQPLEGAGFDPAFIPGLTSPASVAPKGAKKEDAAEEADSEETALDADEPGTEAADVIDDADDDAEDAVDGAEEADDEDDDTEDAPVDGPVFEAADRRARIAVDHKGVRLALDDQECEFRWDEIGAIETESPRFGKRYTVTVHTPDRRWYPIEIEATARSSFKEWDEQLDAVLDAYFEEGAEAAAEESDAD
ncbi:hypothetical protein DMH25_41740 [Streptomyces sp. WAC 01325]|uniref:hypothetical protein n=1 Tax=Streptomyces TaxID=1883 RepID=UPI000F881888|nr:hypothetical protein [Streptomyces sp. WAC 01325]RSM87766.1 hypothetical protein DMH25_41740 [Streptomyces sp. WAC 01325]WCH93981.1 hypothetical protein POD33_18355 [Streptomyces moderatus]